MKDLRLSDQRNKLWMEFDGKIDPKVFRTLLYKIEQQDKEFIKRFKEELDKVRVGCEDVGDYERMSVDEAEDILDKLSGYTQ